MKRLLIPFFALSLVVPSAGSSIFTGWSPHSSVSVTVSQGDGTLLVNPLSVGNLAGERSLSSSATSEASRLLNSAWLAAASSERSSFRDARERAGRGSRDGRRRGNRSSLSNQELGGTLTLSSSSEILGSTLGRDLSGSEGLTLSLDTSDLTAASTYLEGTPASRLPVDSTSPLIISSSLTVSGGGGQGVGSVATSSPLILGSSGFVSVGNLNFEEVFDVVNLTPISSSSFAFESFDSYDSVGTYSLISDSFAGVEVHRFSGIDHWDLGMHNFFADGTLRIVAIPEPSHFALISFGFAGLLLGRRRSKE